MNDHLKGAVWIWRSEALGANAYADFAGRFFASDASSEAKYFVYISADSNFSIYINGHFADCGQFPDYPEYKICEKIDVTRLVLSGDNSFIIGAHSMNADCSVYRKGRPGVIFTVVCENAGSETVLYASGKDTFSRVSPYYASAGVPNISNQMLFSFAYDAAPGSEKEAFDPHSDPVDGMPEKLYPRPVKRMTVQPPVITLLTACGSYVSDTEGTAAERMQNSLMRCRALPRQRRFPHSEGVSLSAGNDDGVYAVFDLGKESVGYLDLDLDVPEECEVLIGWGEHLDDLRVRTSVGGRNFAGSYKAAAGRNAFFMPFRRVGLRYLQIFVHAKTALFRYAGIRPAVYPLSHTPFFRCSDALHNKIYETCLKTLECCMHDHYEDCPWREQALYTMDSRNQMLCGYYAFGEYDFPKASLRLMALSLRDDGMLELCSPGRVPITIPSFSAMFNVSAYEYLIHSGDTGFIKEILPCCAAIADGFISRIDENGLLGAFSDKRYWNFYEWSPGLSGDALVPSEGCPTYDAPLCAFVSMSLGCLSDIYAILGDAEKKEYYAAAKTALNEKINEAFWCEQEGAYCSYVLRPSGKKVHFAELTNALAVYCGAAGEPRLSRVLRLLASGDGSLSPITLSHSIFKYDALMTKPMLYAKTVFESVESIWGGMLYKGATTFFEVEAGADAFGYAGSLCHGWSAVPAYLYFRYILGASPDPSGSTEYTFSPVGAGFRDVSGKLLLPDGTEKQI